MKNPKSGEEVKYVGGFHEFEMEDWTIVTAFPNGNDMEVFGNNSHRLITKSRIDFDRIN